MSAVSHEDLQSHLYLNSDSSPILPFLPTLLGARRPAHRLDHPLDRQDVVHTPVHLTLPSDNPVLGRLHPS
jgi:hypothetical protein